MFWGPFAPSLCLLPPVPPSYLFRGFSSAQPQFRRPGDQEAREPTPLLCFFCSLSFSELSHTHLAQNPWDVDRDIHSPSGRGQRCPRPGSVSEENQDLVFQWQKGRNRFYHRPQPQPACPGNTCPKAISWGGNGNIHQIVANLVVLRALSVLLIHLICFNPVCSALL